jgi:hypothetical protein
VPTIKQTLSQVANIDKGFAGTVAFKNEKLSLPDGSKVAIGMDGERWVIVYQEAPQTPFVVYEYNAAKSSVVVDKKLGGADAMEKVKKMVNYFFEHADVDDLVTIESGEVKNGN